MVTVLNLTESLKRLKNSFKNRQKQTKTDKNMEQNDTKCHTNRSKFQKLTEAKNLQNYFDYCK